MSHPRIRPAASADRGALRTAIAALQEHERRLHDSRLPGEAMADAYLAWMESRAETKGALLVAEFDGQFIGFVAGWIEEDESIAETPDSNRYAYISDIFVAPPWRRRGVAASLIAEMERCLARPGISRLRMAALAANTMAGQTYLNAGFSPYEIVYEKRLTRHAILIREEQPADFAAVRALTTAAFAGVPDAEGDEADFVERQRAGGSYIPALALIGEDGDGVVGHVMLTRFRVAGVAKPARALLLAIVSVSPSRQRAGLGSRLAREALSRAKTLGFQAAFVLGDPAFYRRFGFRAASDFGIAHADGYASENVMALEIERGALASGQGRVTFPK